MLIWINARIRILSLTILGSIVGALGGLWLGRAMLLRTAKADLSAYADELRRNADGLSDEINSILREMNASTMPACSNLDLAALRAQTFRYVHVKDVGRTRDGKLYCSAFLGRLSQPHIEGAPSLVLANGANVYTDVAVLMDSKGSGQGTIVEGGDVDVVSRRLLDRRLRLDLRGCCQKNRKLFGALFTGRSALAVIQSAS